MYSSLAVVITDRSIWIWDKQIKVQFLILHSVIVARELLHFSWMYELMKKSWFRRNCIGDNNVDELGIRIIAGAKQSKFKKIFKWFL